MLWIGQRKFFDDYAQAVGASPTECHQSIPIAPSIVPNPRKYNAVVFLQNFSMIFPFYR